MTKDTQKLDDILTKSFNAALQDLQEPNAVSMTPEQHIAEAKQQIIEWHIHETQNALQELVTELNNYKTLYGELPDTTDFENRLRNKLKGE